MKYKLTVIAHATADGRNCLQHCQDRHMTLRDVCPRFDVMLVRDPEPGRERYLRCRACLAAERARKPGHRRITE